MDGPPKSLLCGTLSNLPIELQRRLLEAQYPNIRKLREAITEALIHQNVEYETPVAKLLDIDCPILVRYERLDFEQLLQGNCQNRTAGLQKVQTALGILVKYGVNLLKPMSSRPQGWAAVNFSNSVFRDKVDAITGARKILHNLGYTVITEEAICYPKNTQPHLDTVSKVTTDIVIAKSEIKHFLLGTHRYPVSFKSLMPSPISPADDRNNNGDNQQTYVVNSNETNNRGQNDLSSEINKDWASGWAGQTLPQTGKADKENITPPAADDCDICGAAKADWMCSLCDKKRLCTSCDDRWHSHPKRREHKRSPIDKQQAENAKTTQRKSEDPQLRQVSENAIMVIPPKARHSQALGDAMKISPHVMEVDVPAAEDTKATDIICVENQPNSPIFEKVPHDVLPPRIDLTTEDRDLHIELLHSNYDSIVFELDGLNNLSERLQQLNRYLQKLERQIKANDTKISELVRKTAEFTSQSNYLTCCFARDKLKREHMLLVEYKKTLSIEQKSSATSMSDDQLNERLHELKSMVRPPPETYGPSSSSPSTSSSSLSEVRLSKTTLSSGSSGLSAHDRVSLNIPGILSQSPPVIIESKVSSWNCTFCTLENRLRDKICAACANERRKTDACESDGKAEHGDGKLLINLEPSTPDGWTELDASVTSQGGGEHVDMTSIFIQDQQAEEQFLREQAKKTVQTGVDIIDIKPVNPQEDELKKENEIDATNDLLPEMFERPEIRIPNINHGVDECWSMLDVPSDGDPTPSFFERVDTVKKTLGTDIKNRVTELEIEKNNQELAAQGRLLIRQLKFAENSGYTLDEYSLAQKKSYPDSDPVSWLKNEWEILVQQFITTATDRIKSKQTTYQGEFPAAEAKQCLLQNEGRFEEAVATGVHMYLNKLSQMSESISDMKSLMNSLNLHKGDLEKTRDTVVSEHIRTLNQTIWAAPESSNEENIYADMTMDCDEAALRNKNIPYERRIRMVLVTTELPWFKSEDVVQLLDCPDMPEDTTYEDILEAVRNVDTVEDATAFLCNECEICYTTFPPRKILSLSSCQCKVCDQCMKQHLEVVIKGKHVKDMTCPVCLLPDVQNPDEIGIHFSFLENIIQVLAVSRDIYELYLKKLTEWNLMKDPHFRWCSHCGSGFIFQGEDRQLKMICPNCRKPTCYGCKKPWETQHDGISCENYQRWKEDNDPNFQAAGLKKHLEANGIDCPSCKMRYSLAKGGCMHFKCTQCKHEFCCGCSQPFKIGKACKKLKKCAKAGLHCHHPRDCLYYLRDFDVQQLMKLLQDHDVEISGESSTDPGLDKPKCHVMEQKETTDGLNDDPCGRPAPEDFFGLCEIHFKEYLVSLVNREAIDPVEIMDVQELKTQVERLEKNPPKQKKKEKDDAYKTRLIEFIRAEIPLPMRRTQSMASVHLI